MNIPKLMHVARVNIGSANDPMAEFMTTNYKQETGAQETLWRLGSFLLAVTFSGADARVHNPGDNGR